MLTLAIAGGCGRSDNKTATTQVAAKINSAEITVSQVNAVLARTPTPTPEAAERVTQGNREGLSSTGYDGRAQFPVHPEGELGFQQFPDFFEIIRMDALVSGFFLQPHFLAPNSFSLPGRTARDG